MSNDSSPAAASSHSSRSSRSSNSSGKPRGLVKEKPPLPESWMVRQSSTYPDRVYYFNVVTGVSTWEMPELGVSDAASHSPISSASEPSDQPGNIPRKDLPSKSGSKLRLSKKPCTATSQGLNSGSAISKNRLPPKVKGHASVMWNRLQADGKGKAKTLCELSQKAASKARNSLSEQEERVHMHIQRLKDSRTELVNKKRNLGITAVSPPWGIPLRGSHLPGSLTSESLTPRSLPSRGGPSDASSVSSLSSKLGSPTALKLQPAVKRKEKAHGKSSSSDNQSSPLKSKQRKATALAAAAATAAATHSEKSSAEASFQTETPKRSLASRNSDKEASRRTLVKQPSTPVMTDKDDLRRRIERSRRFKSTHQHPKESPETQTSLDSIPKAPSKIPLAAKYTKNPRPDFSENSLGRDPLSQPQQNRVDRGKLDTMKMPVSTRQSKAKLSHTSSPVETEHRTVFEITKTDFVDPTEYKEPDVVSFPAVEEDDDLSQMEIDIPEVDDNNENTSNSNMGLRIVLDTNILMHDLQFVRKLLDQCINGLGRPILIIPWVVMQELDGLKAGSVKGDNAWMAVQFLHKCFMNEHPRVRGEPMCKASDEADFEITCNDDWILQCCLRNQKKVGKDLVVLLSNDKHLCSKAVINSIRAFSTEKLLSGLEALVDIIQHQVPLPPMPSETPPPRNSDPRATVTLCPRTPSPVGGLRSASNERNLCDELVCETKELLHHCLSVVLETEMKAAYEDLWTEIVVVKPPWSFQDILQCFEKHWIAVFGFFLNREDKRHFLQIVELTDVLQIELPKVKQLITNSIYFCRRLRQHSRYNDALDQPILSLEELKKHCRFPTLEGKNASNQVLPNEKSVSLEIDKDNSTDIVSFVFERIWLKILQLSALIFEGLGVPHDLETDRTAVIPSELECHACLNVLCPLLQELIEALERVMQMPNSCVMEKPIPFDRLCTTVHAFMGEFVPNERDRYARLTTLALQRFILVYSNQQMLRNGIVQLTNALTKLAQCQGMPS